MILSTAEKKVIGMLLSIDGGYMPVSWFKRHYQGAVPRLRELGLLHKRDPHTARLTKLGRSTASALSSNNKG